MCNIEIAQEIDGFNIDLLLREGTEELDVGAGS